MDADPTAPRRKKPRRYTAEPQRVSDSTLVGSFALPHGAGRPEPKTATTAQHPAGTDGGADVAPGSESGAGAARPSRSPAPTVDPVFQQTAAEDDPRRWGDAHEDLGDWMKSQRPPHWS